MKSNPISATVDFAADGVQHGHLKQPHSDDRSAWGAIMTPVTVIRNGDGPTVLITGANHGDEYEGPVALLNLANEINPEDVTGRIIMVPMMNYPAFCAGRRTSPIDHGNMNRSFPGRPDGTATEKMADYFNRYLLPLADFVLDIHAGGKTLDFVPFAAAHRLDDKPQQGKCAAAMRAFAAPYSVMLLELDAAAMYDTAAEKQGRIFVSTEVGGGGSTTPTTNEITRSGVRNFCIHAGALRGEPVVRPTINIDTADENCFITAEYGGLLELALELGAPVAQGQLVAKIHNIERTGVEPVRHHAPLSGILVGRHFPGLVRPGDCVALIGMIMPD